MTKNRLLKLAAAVLTVPLLYVLVQATTAAPAQGASRPAASTPYHVAPVLGQPCTQGDEQYQNVKDPARLGMKWTSNGCNWQARPLITYCNSLCGLHAKGGWVRTVGLVSAANGSGPGSTLQTGMLEQRAGQGSQIFCFNTYPTAGTAWYKC